MKYDKLSDDEKAIENNMEELKPISGTKKKKIEHILENAKKNRSISLRISNFDLEKLKQKANTEGVPYQTLITSILHKYVTNQLYEKEEMLKSIKLFNEVSE